MTNSAKSSIRSLLFVCGQACVIYLAVFFFFHPCVVSGSSMEPTYHSGQIVITDASFTEDDITYDTIVCFREDGRRLIKRVVGLPGDRIRIVDGQLVRNGEIVDEEFDQMENAGLAENELVVEEGQYFVLGDNRNNSRDSRIFGTIAYSDITNIL